MSTCLGFTERTLLIMSIPDQSSGPPYSVRRCCDANHETQHFYSQLSLKPDGDARYEFLKDASGDESETIAIVALLEIGKSNSPGWLNCLLRRARVEHRATVLAAIYGAIGQLGGFMRQADVRQLFLNTDTPSRAAALIAVDSLADEDAKTLLFETLMTDLDVSLRDEAAIRLAYRGSDAGKENLLRLLEANVFATRIRAACALCFLRDSRGIALISDLLGGEAALSNLENCILVTCLYDFLSRTQKELIIHVAEPESFGRVVLEHARQFFVPGES